MSVHQPSPRTAPVPRRRRVPLVAAPLTVALAAGVLLPATATSAPAEQVRTTSTVAPQPGPAAGGGTRPGYHYAAAAAYTPSGTWATGFGATFTVHNPRQVKARRGQHSIGQLAVSDTTIGLPYLEAGWRKGAGLRSQKRPRLFVFWRPVNSGDTCYNFGCGFVRKGKGKKPGAKLRPGSKVKLEFVHRGSKWWFKVNGKKSGYYPDRLWRGRFTRANFAQVFGEIYVHGSDRLCADMGNGRRPGAKKRSARISKVHWTGGPSMALTRGAVTDPRVYGLTVTSATAMRFGGPGRC